MESVKEFIVATSFSLSSVIKLFLCCLFVFNSETLGLKCVCNPNECETIRSEDCPGRGLIVWDPCRCCRVCARTFGEACGGPGDFSGTCEPPLSCVSKIPVGGSGICLEIPEYIDAGTHLFQNCSETITVESGCEIVNRKCKCWDEMQLCKTKSITKWDFKNLEECQLNAANLMKSELDFDDDYTISPKLFLANHIHLEDESSNVENINSNIILSCQ